MRNEVGMVSPRALKELMDNGTEFVLIDVLDTGSYKSRHLPGAVNAPAHEDDFLERVAELVTDKKDKIVVYCSSQESLASPIAARDLAGAGYEHVFDFDMGLKGWKEAGFDFA